MTKNLSTAVSGSPAQVGPARSEGARLQHSGRILEIKQMGFMMALAVLIDADIVRLLLVPALMRLMGSWNWWLPRCMERFLPRTSTNKA